MSNNIKINQKGQSLIELLVAMGIFALVISSIMFLTLDAHMANRQGGERSEAAWLAQSGIEAAQSIKNRGWKYLETGNHGLIINNNRWEFAGAEDNFDKYSRQISVEPVYRDVSGDITETGGQIDFDTKKVVADVAWDFSPARPSEVVIGSIFTNWRSHKWIQTSQAEFDQGAMSNIVSTSEGEGAVELVQGVAQYWGNQFLIESFGTAGNLSRRERQVAMTFTAQNTGPVSEISAYIEEERGNSPVYRYGLQSDASGIPSGNWLGLMGLGYGDLQATTSGWQMISLSENVNLTAGQIYHLVVQWQSGTVNNNNYISLRSSRPQNNMAPYDNTNDPYLTVHWNNGSRWINSLLEPIFVIIYSDKTFKGNTYTENPETPIYRDLLAGQEFLVPGGDREVSGISFYTKKNTNRDPADDLYVILYDITSGSQIDQGTLATADTISRNYEWRSYDFPAPVTLIDGYQYRIYLSSPGSDDRDYYLIYQLRNEDSIEFNSVNYLADTSVFSDSRNGGTSWDAYRNSDVGGYRFSSSTGYALSGDFISGSFDTGSDETVYNYFDWTSDVPAGASLSFQVRTANRRNTLGSAVWVGPDGTPGSFYSTQGQVITNDPAAAGLLWVQYRAYFTSDGSSTPKLFDSTIDYEP